jgi:NAD(P)-dependent dehydrogenase (short-subunit alcohol dehydrogenase family)
MAAALEIPALETKMSRWLPTIARTCFASVAAPSRIDRSAFAATKGALDTLVKHWAATLGPRGIRVNAVAPGVIGTDMSNFTKTEAGRGLTLTMQALKRIGQPSDVADVIAFIASDGARWITGCEHSGGRGIEAVREPDKSLRKTVR